MTDKTPETNEIQEQDKVFISEMEQQIIDNKAVIAAYDKRYAQPAPDPSLPWEIPGEIHAYQEIPNGLLLHCDHIHLELLWLAPDALRVRAHKEREAFADYFSYAVPSIEPIPVDLRIVDSEVYITVYTSAYHYTIRKHDAQIRCYDDDNHTVFQQKTSALWRDDGSVGVRMKMQEDEGAYGTGERAFNLNLRGRTLSLWNTDPGGYERGEEPINYCIAFYLGVHGQGAYGLLWDNPARGFFDLGDSEADELLISAEAGGLCYYLFPGTEVNAVLERYTQFTGRMPLPPLWALGYHQSRYSYFTQEEVLETAKTLRERQIPCDAIYLDIHYMDGFRIFTWDKEAFPDMKGMIDELHAMGFKLVPIMDPGTKVDAGYTGHDSGVEQGVFVRYPDGEYAAGVVWPGLCYFPDFTNPQARQWWQEQLRPLLETGVDGLWNDMNEPLIFDNVGKPKALPDYTQHDNEGRGGTHRDVHNVYGMLMGEASYDALRQQRPGKRQFSIIRAGAAGAQRKSLSWTGDNVSTWDDLRLSISTVLQMGLSGVAFTGADIGGFARDTNGELLARWTQAGALLPFFRNHSAIRTARQEPWSFGERYERAIQSAIALRYRLLPYLYTAVAQSAFTGVPIVRPLFTAEPHNPHLRSIDDCYLLGDKLLVAPILEEHALRRTVYLPEGDWYNFHTNQRYEGGKLISVEGDLDTLPLFVKSGTALPMWPVMQHTAERRVDALTLRIYTDSGETVLYEDAGEGLAYQNGDYRWVHFLCDESTDSLTMERRVEGSFQPSYTSVELQLVGASQVIGVVQVDGNAMPEWHYVDGILSVDIPADFEHVHIAI